ncbi:MAG: gamma-glutamyltransferase [Alphaproteobacteria bacterium]|nr:gamma-glutamyltransferase [Alphaproteobacteria bacterium]
MRHTVLLAFILAFSLPLPTQAAEQRSMVAAAHPLAVDAGLAALKAGGNAMDAAVAVQMVLALVEPAASGLGGGAFLLHYDAASGAVTSWDGRETAPAAVQPALFLDPNGSPLGFRDAALGGRAVGVPGVIRMLEAAHQAHGKLPWETLVTPAAHLAAEGFLVSARLARLIAADQDGLRRQDATRAYFLPGGSPLPQGTTLKNPVLADTLRRVAGEGASTLYRGPIAADIAATVRADPNPGLMTTDDLAAYQAKARPAICGPYREHTICGMGPPSSGGVAVLQALGLLSHFDLSHMDPRGADAAQAVVEAERLAFADRDRYLADPDFVSVPSRGLIEPGYLQIRAQQIDLDRAIAAPQAGNPFWNTGHTLTAPQPAQPEHGTSQICIIDAAGNAVSMTTTIEATFGSRLMVHGFLLNNELTDFSFRPEINGRPVANRVEPGKRPRSSMAPTLVFDRRGHLEACVGSAGGSRIIGYVAQTLIGLLDWRLPADTILAAPHVQSVGVSADLEAGTEATGLAEALQARGQKTATPRMDSGSQMIVLTPSGPVGAADPRREGVAGGS